MASIVPDSWGMGAELATSRVILREVLWGHIRTREAHHRDFREIRAEGGSPEAAVGNLVLQLTRVLDTAITSLDRERLERALTDVRSFAAVAADRGAFHIPSP